MKIPLSNYNREFLFYDGQDRVVMGGGGGASEVLSLQKKKGGGIATLKGEGGGAQTVLR